MKAFTRLKRTGTFTAALFTLAVAPLASAQLTTELKPETLAAFDDYVKVVEKAHNKRNDGQKPFLWIDESGNRQRVRSGGIVTHKFKHIDIRAPNGLIHDWLGAMFIPERTIDDVVAVMQGFQKHADIYPEVVKARLIARKGDLVQSYLRLVKKKVITVTLDSEYDAYYERLGDDRMVVRSYSTKMAQVDNAGEPDERIRPPGKDSGFLWRLNAYWRMEQRDGGVFVELSTISLTRDIPRGLGWMIKPFITSIPEESLVSTLEATRRETRK